MKFITYFFLSFFRFQKANSPSTHPNQCIKCICTTTRILEEKGKERIEFIHIHFLHSQRENKLIASWYPSNKSLYGKGVSKTEVPFLMSFILIHSSDLQWTKQRGIKTELRNRAFLRNTKWVFKKRVALFWVGFDSWNQWGGGSMHATHPN